MCVLSRFSRVRLFVTPWTVARQAPLSMGFSRQDYRRGLPCPPSGDLSDPGIKPMSPASPAFVGGFLYQWSHLGSPHKSQISKLVMSVKVVLRGPRG